MILFESNGFEDFAWIPVEFFGFGSPSATVFGHVLEGLKEGEVIDDNIAALFRQEVFNPLVLF